VKFGVCWMELSSSFRIAVLMLSMADGGSRLSRLDLTLDFGTFQSTSLAGPNGVP